MPEETQRPAWSQHFTPDAIKELQAEGPLAKITPAWAWGGSTGKGVRVAVVDSGVEHDHPALEGSVRGGVIIEYDSRAENNYRVKPDNKPTDVSGHGTCLCRDHSFDCPGSRNLQRARAGAKPWQAGSSSLPQVSIGPSKTTCRWST